jgi:hypothetical protein
MTPLLQILGWIEHCQRELPEKATMIPVWLCASHEFQKAVDDGYVEEISQLPFHPRMGITQIIYGLTDKGRQAFYDMLPRIPG